MLSQQWVKLNENIGSNMTQKINTKLIDTTGATEGSALTDPSTFTDEMIADAGYILAPDKPEEVDGKIIVWSNGEWVYEDAPIDSSE
jgi:hypothetical protein